jgi:hypothetical protein
LIRKKKPSHIVLGVSLLGIVLSLSSFVLLNSSTRWWAPIQHVLYDRRNTVSDLAPYFKENGFDLTENQTYLMDPLAFKKITITADPIIKSEKLSIAKKIYVKYLLSHPKYTFIQPFSEFNNIINPDNLSYRYEVEKTPAWVIQLSNLSYPKGFWVIAVGIICCILYLSFSKQFFKPTILLVIFLILSVIPLGMLNWLSVTVEIQRHSQQLLLQSRIGFWISILILGDYLIEKILVGRKKPSI